MALSEHLEKLRYFHQVCGHPSILAASRSMGISQAGLSKSIQSLETALNVTLFVRSNEGLILTQSGKILFESTEKILKEALQAEASLSFSSKGAIPISVHCGMYDSIAVYFYSALAQYFSAVYPSLKLNMTIDKSLHLAECIHDGSLDLAIGVNFQQHVDGHSEYRHLWHDEYGFYINSRLGPPSNELPLIFFPDATDENGLKLQDEIATLLGKRPQVRVYNFETIKALTLNSIGCGVLPGHVAKPLIYSGQLKQINLAKRKQSFGKHSIGLLMKKNFMKKHHDFVNDLYRLGSSWAKS